MMDVHSHLHVTDRCKTLRMGSPEHEAIAASLESYMIPKEMGPYG